MGANGGQRQGVWRPVATVEGTDRAGGPGPGSGVADGPQAGRAGVVTTALTVSFTNQRPLSPFDVLFYGDRNREGHCLLLLLLRV